MAIKNIKVLSYLVVLLAINLLSCTSNNSAETSNKSDKGKDNIVNDNIVIVTLLGDGTNNVDSIMPIYVALPSDRSSTELYIADVNDQSIKKFNMNTGAIEILAGGMGAGTNLNQINNPAAVELDDDNNIYVVDENNARVIRFPYYSKKGSNGEIIAQGYINDHENQLNAPASISVDSKDHYLFVCDYLNNQVLRFPTNGNYKTQGTVILGRSDKLKGNALNELNGPTDLCLSNNELRLYICDKYNDRIISCDKDGKNIKVVAGDNGYGSDSNQFSLPLGLDIDDNNNIYIADAGNNRIVKWPVGAKYGTTIVNNAAIATNRQSDFFIPFGIVVDKAGNLFIADTYRHRVEEIINNLKSNAQ
ncbi:MAG: NHL repeat-containing protein [Phycisphaerales bacterium]|nr:NHL repeat-containing protein [Phycisphaerales bacterium]